MHIKQIQQGNPSPTFLANIATDELLGTAPAHLWNQAIRALDAKRIALPDALEHFNAMDDLEHPDREKLDALLKFAAEFLVRYLQSNRPEFFIIVQQEKMRQSVKAEEPDLTDQDFLYQFLANRYLKNIATPQ